MVAMSQCLDTNPYKGVDAIFGIQDLVEDFFLTVIKSAYILRRLASRWRWDGWAAQLQAFLAVALHFLLPTCLPTATIIFFKGSISIT